MTKPDDRVHLLECQKNIDSSLDCALREFETNKIQIVREIFDRIKSIAPSFVEPKEDGIQIVDAFALGLLTRFLFSCLVDADRINSAEFEDPERKRRRTMQKNNFTWQEAIVRIEQCMLDFDNDTEVNRIRSDISNDCLRRAKDLHGIYTLTVPTAEAKH